MVIIGELAPPISGLEIGGGKPRSVAISEETYRKIDAKSYPRVHSLTHEFTGFYAAPGAHVRHAGEDR